MARRTLKDRNTRKLGKSGNSVSVTLPIEIIRQLGWRLRQKVVVKKQGTKIIIQDWKP